MFDCCVVRFVSPFSTKKSNFQNGLKSRENRTNIDIILSFLAKPVDKHGITLVYITYPPLNFPVNNLALVSLCIKNLTFKTWNWFLIRKQMEDHGPRRHPRLRMIEQVFVVH